MCYTFVRAKGICSVLTCNDRGPLSLYFNILLNTNFKDTNNMDDFNLFPRILNSNVKYSNKYICEF